jgi:DNA polymerase III delta prime subunit
MTAPSQHTFDTIWGHDRQKEHVLRLLAEGRLPAVLLLEGPDGLGKRSFALAAAKVILSASRVIGSQRMDAPPPAFARRKVPPPPPDGEPDLFGGMLEPEAAPAEEDGALDLFAADGPPPKPARKPAEPKAAPALPPTAPDAPPAPVAPPAQPSVRIRPTPFVGLDPKVCRSVEASYPVKFDEEGRPGTIGHPDLSIIEPPGRSRSILVGQIQALHDIAALAPIQSAYRLVIIFGADTITASAANSMLKLLEEPPTYLRFILVTDQPTRLLPTIRSRCSRLPFYPMPRPEIARLLVERERIAPDLAEVAAALSEGRPGVALKIANGDLLQKRRELFEARLLLDRYGIAALSAAAHRAATAGGDPASGVQLLLGFLRDRMVRRLARDAPHLLVNRDLMELLDAAKPPLESLAEEVDRLLDALDATAHPYVPNANALMQTALWPTGE